MNDVAISIPDGITVPFVIAVGLSVVTPSTSTVIIAGISITITGAITMALGAYFTTKTESEHFNADIKSKDQKEREFLSRLGINEEVQEIAAGEIIKENDRWSDLMRQAEDKNQAGKKGVAIALAYMAGGIIPLIPFFMYNDMNTAIKACVLITFTGLVISGFIRSRITAVNPWAGTLRILVFAGIAAGCAFGVATIING